MHDPETMECGVRSLYIFGVVAAGVSVEKLFIEKGRHHTVPIVQHLLSRSGESPRASLAPTPLCRFQDRN